MRWLSSTKRKKPLFTIDEPRESVASIGKENEWENDTVPGSDLLAEITQQLRKMHPDPKRDVGRGTPEFAAQNSADSSFTLIADLIPILDSIERTLDLARAHKDNELLKNWIATVAAIHRKLRSILFRHGLKEIETIGQKVDFNLHEVVEYCETNDFPENSIVAQKQKGYLFRGNVIRDAKVVVAKQKAKS
ncbi:MAG: nucleotide exchange factor GrpE [bacterium]|nr:nucleotide exchange factor GrpE [bacterium]